MCSCSISIQLSSQDETAGLARALAPLVAGGDVILLEGSIGAGKSFFARALISTLLIEPEDIPSPTFTLVQTYDAAEFEIWHCDLYRLTTPFEAQELGLEEAFETALCLVEWPDRLGDLTPQDALVLTLEVTDTLQARRATLRATTPRWCAILESLDV